MQKRILSGIVIVCLLLLSCNSNDKASGKSGKAHKFNIEGKFENGAGRNVYLEKIGTESFVPLDTSLIAENGEFSFKESTSIPEFFIVKTEEGQFINLLLYGKEKIKISSDYNNLLEYTVEGSEESSKIRDLNMETSRIIGEMDKLSQIARDSADSPNYVALQMKNNENFQLLMADLKEYSQNYIDQNEGSLISLLALYGQVGPQMMVFHPIKDLTVYEKVDSILYEKYPSVPLVENLHEYISVIKAQVASQEQSSSGRFAPGTAVPDIALLSPEGKTIKLSSLKGKIVLLDFWAAWCQPCRQENPNLVVNYNKYNKKGFEIYQVSLDRTREDWINGIKQDKLNWTHVSELKYWESSVVSQFGIQGIPMNYLLDKEGKVIAGNLRGSALGEKLEELFNQ
jgi:peroxiredoxin